MKNIFYPYNPLKSIPDISKWNISNVSEIDSGTIFLYIIKALKKSLIEIQKSGEKKGFDFEIKSTNEELKSTNISIHDIKKPKFKEIFDYVKEYIHKSVFILSFSFNCNDENLSKSLENLKKFSDKKVPDLKVTIHFEIKREGEKIFIYLCFLKIIQDDDFLLLLEEILNLFEFIKFDTYIKTGFSGEDLSLSPEHLKLKLDKFYLSIKFEPDILSACIQTLKGIKLANDTFEKETKDAISNLNMIKQKKGFLVQKCGFMSENVINLLKSDIGFSVILVCCILKDLIEKDYLDEITIYFGYPKYENGFMVYFNIPGLSKFA